MAPDCDIIILVDKREFFWRTDGVNGTHKIKHSKKRENSMSGSLEKPEAHLPPRAFLLRMAVGVVIGIGGILPGVSGGVMAVSLGLYVPMIQALANFFKTPKKSFHFLLPVGIGAVAGFLLGAVVLKNAMDRWYEQVLWLFLGLVAGGLPGFIREANEGGFNRRYLIATAFGAALAAILLILDNDSQSAVELESLTPWQALASGAVVSAGTVFPGLSTSFILMYLGWYKPMMDAFAGLQAVTVICVGIGAAACFCATVRAARWIFDRFHGYAYYAVLGFLVVSAALIFPGLSQGWLLSAVDILLAACGAAGAYLMERINIQ